MNVSTIQLCSTEPDGSTTVHIQFAVSNQNRTQPFVLRAATGLDTDEIIKTYNDGPQFFRMQPSQRVVKFSIKLNPNYKSGLTLGDLRDKVYKMITYNTKAKTWNSDSKIEIKFWDGDTYVASLFGFILRVESSAFTAETDLNLEIHCDYPFLQANYVRNMGIENTIYPPRSYDKEINVGDWHHVNIHAMTWHDDVESTAQHGWQMNLKVKNLPQSQFVMFDTRNPDKYLFWVVYEFRPHQIIHFSSNENNKFIFVADKNDVFIASLMDRILWGSVWPFMLPGPNQFDISEGFQITSVSHAPTYWGI